MSSARARSTLLAAALCLSCQDPRGVLDLDTIDATLEAGDCVESIHASLELGGPIHQFVSDGSGAGGWALISAVGDDGLTLALERVPASADESPTALLELGLSPSLAAYANLRAGQEPGELWLFVDGPSTSLLSHILPALGEIGRNEFLANFPVFSPGSSCPTTHTRLLLLARGRPYILALPDCSDTPGLTLHLLAIDPELLGFGQSWQLEFDPCATIEDPASCALELAYSLAEISRASTAIIATTNALPVGFATLRVFDQLSSEHGSERRDIVLLDLHVDSEGPNARLVTYPGVWSTTLPTELGPIHVSRDLYSTQLFIRNILREDDAALLRFDSALERDDLVRDVELLPFASQAELIQLRNQSAMLANDEGLLEAISLVDIDAWPTWTKTSLLELPDLLGLEQAGLGHVLLRGEQTPPQLLRVRCLD